MISRKHKKFCINLNFIEDFLILAFTITECILMSAFTSLLGILGIPIGSTSSEIRLKFCLIAAGVKNYKPINKKKKKKHDDIVLLAKSKINSVEVLIFKAFIDSNISLDEFLSINNVPK